MYELGDNAAANLALANSYLRYGDVIKEPNERQQKLDSAQRLYEKALEINPNSPVAYSGLANVAILYANYKEAVGYIERYIELDNTNDYIYYLGAMCYRKLWKDRKVEMVSKMEDALERSIALNPKNNKVYLYLAETAEYNGENDEAKEYIKKAEMSTQGWIEEEKKLLTDMKARLNIK
jgi:Tfp pilus assembly protein PilF